MKLIDVHSHLEWPSLQNDLDNIVRRAKEKSVIAAISSSVTLKSASDVLRLAEKYKGFVYPCMGLSPSEIKKHPDTFDKFVEYAIENKDRYLALGEIGLDYYWIKDKENRAFVEEKFVQLLNLANDLEKSIIIHCRDAEKRTIELIEEHYDSETVHMHCFSGSTDLIERGLNNGWYFSVPTSVVNRSYHKKLADTVPLERMMLETDAPFLSPIKGKRHNEPANIEISAEYIAKRKGTSVGEVASSTTKNAKEFYHLPI